MFANNGVALLFSQNLPFHSPIERQCELCLPACWPVRLLDSCVIDESETKVVNKVSKLNDERNIKVNIRGFLSREARGRLLLDLLRHTQARNDEESLK